MMKRSSNAKAEQSSRRIDAEVGDAEERRRSRRGVARDADPEALRVAPLRTTTPRVSPLRASHRPLAFPSSLAFRANEHLGTWFEAQILVSLDENGSGTCATPDDCTDSGALATARNAAKHRTRYCADRRTFGGIGGSTASLDVALLVDLLDLIGLVDPEQVSPERCGLTVHAD